MAYNKDLIEIYLSGPQGLNIITATSFDSFKLRVVSISINLTYRLGPIIQGTPNEEINKQTLKEIHNNVKHSDRHETPIYFMPIEEKNIKTSLPSMYYVLEIESNSTSEDFMFSSLLFVSFHDQIDQNKIKEMIQLDLSKLEWAKVSTNWNL